MLKVMIVDNETAIRKGLIHCIHWETLDCIVCSEAADGVDALEQIPLLQPDIIISDIRMPGMDGLELSRQISQIYPRIKVILLTGFPDFEYAQRAIKYQVVDFVLKPTSVESITQAIEKAKMRILENISSENLERRLVSQSEENLRLERSMLIRDLINRVKLSHLYVLNRMAQLRLNLISYHLLRLDIALLIGGSKEEENLLPYLHQSQKVLTDSLSEYEVYFVPRGDQTCYAVVCISDAALLQERCLETVDILGSLPRFTLSIGISRYCTDPLDMASAAEQANQASQIARYSAEQPVIRYDCMPKIPSQTLNRIFDDLKLLKSAIENHNSTASRDILLRLFSFIREHKLPSETAHNICLYIHQFCISLLFLPNMSGYLSENGLPVLKQFTDYSSVEQMEQYMLAFVEQMLATTRTEADETAGVIQTVQSYISQHFAEELSLDTLAHLVYLSPSYLSRLFKRETGENLSTYVQNIRIEEAKMLLRTTSLKTYEVAERVGISDPVYFSRIFKKITGYKPKDFRLLTKEKRV